MKPGEFIKYLLEGYSVARKCWPSQVDIYYSQYTKKIHRVEYNKEDVDIRVWEPTAKDLLAEDWELRRLCT